MKVSDIGCAAKGCVSPSFINVATGETIPFYNRHNTLSYMAAESMAAAFGGDPSYIPSKVGFIYGPSDSTWSKGLDNRDQSWEKLKGELISGVDVQVVDFSYAPTLGRDNSGDSSYDPDNYTNILPTGSNAITFHAVSNSSDKGVVNQTAAFQTDDRLLQAVLLGHKIGSNGQDQYYIIARVSLVDGSTYKQKPQGFEVALDWTIAFH